jgi:hypothetical protein
MASGLISRRPVALVPVFTVALAAACWFASVWQMRGMDMGAATSLGSPASFIGIWMSMVAAMMLPAALPAILAFVQLDSRFVAGLWFVASYLAVWLLFGVAAYGLYRQHGHAAAGALTVLAGLYELTPLKRTCRECHADGRRDGDRACAEAAAAAAVARRHARACDRRLRSHRRRRAFGVLGLKVSEKGNG